MKFTKRIIIGGLPRSGSTLLRVILDSHPNIICGPETGLFLRPFAEQQTRVKQVKLRFEERLNIPPTETAEILAASGSSMEFYDRIMAKTCRSMGVNKRIWAEKSPRNCLHYPRLAREMPEAHFVSMIRDGLDVVTSRLPGRDDYYCSIDRYVEAVRAVVSFDASRHMIVRYEDLIADAEATIRRVLDFCGISFVPAMLEEYREITTTRRSKQEKVRQPITGQWIGRWREAQHADRVAQFLSHSEAQRWMQVSGYDTRLPQEMKKRGSD